MDFTGKNILITGASSGIGKALIMELSRYKCTIIPLARRLEQLKTIKFEASGNPAKIFPYLCDVSQKESVITVFA